MRTFFLTGATGAIGSAIVPLLLALPDTQVRLLIRADSEVALAQRVDDLAVFWGLRGDVGRLARVKAYRGDVRNERFGMVDEEYLALASEATHIIHCAGSVRMNNRLEEARRSAVDSAAAIVALGREINRRGRLEKIDFVSTVGISGKYTGLLKEVWFDQSRRFHNTYEQAKAEAEDVIHAAIIDESLPVTVHRPSMVIGDSLDGRIIHFQIFYFICEFLSGRKTFGIYPFFGDVRLDVIPVDCVAEAIVAASCDAGTVGKIFHLCSGPDRAPRLDDLKERVREMFRAHGMWVPPDITLAKGYFAALTRLATFILPSTRGRALATLPIYLDYLADQQGFGNAAYLEWLASRGVKLPAHEDFVEVALSRYLDERYPVDENDKSRR